MKDKETIKGMEKKEETKIESDGKAGKEHPVALWPKWSDGTYERKNMEAKSYIKKVTLITARPLRVDCCLCTGERRGIFVNNGNLVFYKNI